jgi:DNA mismatch endonuclease (patch repair protein)
MSGVKSKNTLPELKVRKFLFNKGFRYRLHSKKLPGKPDLTLTKYKTTVFINGCFWHGHGCKKSKLPSTNVEFWNKKINGNIERDKKVYKELENLGWKVLLIWECDLKNENTLKDLIKKIRKT